MKKEMIGEVPGNVLGLIGDLSLKLQHGGISPDELALFVQRKNPFENPLFAHVLKDGPTQMDDWFRFYRTCAIRPRDFGEILDIPEKKRGIDRLLIVPWGIEVSRIIDLCMNKFPCVLETATHDYFDDRPTVNRSYAVWVRGGQESDESLKNISVEDLLKRRIRGITLIERLLLELKYHSETGKHLDVDGWTLCSGSRNHDDHSFAVGWTKKGLVIRLELSTEKGETLGTREVVAL